MLANTAFHIERYKADELQAFACKNSFYYFLRLFWDVVVTEPPVFNWHIKYLCDELQSLSEYQKYDMYNHVSSVVMDT
jgi:hypothetical protein